MSQQDLTFFDKALKETYGPGLRNSVNNSSAIMGEAERNKARFVGREVVWSLHGERSPATGMRSESGVLPSPGQQGYDDPRERLKYGYHTIKLTGQVIRLSRGDEGAFVSAMDAEMKGAESDLRNDFARQLSTYALQGTTGTGALARTITAVTAASGLITFGNATREEMGHFFTGMIVGVRDPASAVSSARRTLTGSTNNAVFVTAINRTTKTITVSATRGGAALSFGAGPQVADVVVRADTNSAVQDSWKNEIFSLPILVASTGSLHSIDPATNPVWASAVVGDSNTAISEDILVEAVDAVDVEGDGNGAEANLVIGAHSQRRKLVGRMQTFKRFTMQEAVTPKVGYKGLDLADAAGGIFVAEKYFPGDLVIRANPSELSWQVAPDADFTWDDLDGRVLFKALDGSDGYEARMLSYTQFIALKRNSHVRIDLKVA